MKLLAIVAATMFMQSATPIGGPVLPSQKGTSETIFSHTPTTQATLVIGNGEKIVVTIGFDGKVTLGEGVTLDKASREFWEQISKVYPQVCTPKKPKE